MIVNNIDIKDISVVVQGPISDELTPECLKSVRKYLPGATIILSTWEGSNVGGLDYDKLLLNKDPGCFTYNTVNYNVNRQIVSTANGLRRVKTRYALKIRSDIELVGTNFLEYFGKFKNRCEDLKITKERVIINSLYCANVHKTGFPYHVSDWVFFGLTEDILNIWDIPLQSEESGYFFETHKKPETDRVPGLLSQYVPEQHIFSSFLRKNNVRLKFDYYTDVSKENIYNTECSFANNLVILDYKDYGIKFLKYSPYAHDYSNQYTYCDWLLLYKKYCDDSFKIPFWVYVNNVDLKYIKKLKKHWKNFFQPVERAIKYFLRWLSELFSIVFYIFIIIIKPIMVLTKYLLIRLS